MAFAEGPYEESPGFWVGPNHATIEFSVPELPYGAYEVLHCNDQCTTTFGDIISGILYIGVPPTTSVAVRSCCALTG